MDDPWPVWFSYCTCVFSWKYFACVLMVGACWKLQLCLYLQLPQLQQCVPHLGPWWVSSVSCKQGRWEHVSRWLWQGGVRMAMMWHVPEPRFYIATNKFFIVVSKRSIKWDSLIASLCVSYWCITFTYTLARGHSALDIVHYITYLYVSVQVSKSKLKHNNVVRQTWMERT